MTSNCQEKCSFIVTIFLSSFPFVVFDIANMLRVIISFIILNIIYAKSQGGEMMQALEHIREMATVADKKYDTQSRKILKSLRRDLARRRREMKTSPSTTYDS